MTSFESIQRTNWEGKIPVVLTLAPTSLSSPTTPPSLHVMVSRMTFLHLSLRDAVMRLHKFAPISFISTNNSNKVTIRSEPDPGTMNSDDADDSSKTQQEEQQQDDDCYSKNEESRNHNLSSRFKAENKVYPKCWFEDEETQTALRWHVFAGVLYDLNKSRQDLCSNSNNNKQSSLPWRIKLHFTSYPTSQLLSFDDSDGVLTTIEHSYMNSLKQSLFIQHGTRDVAMSKLNKQYHAKLWDAVRDTTYYLYKEVSHELQIQIDDNNSNGNQNSGEHSNARTKSTPTKDRKSNHKEQYLPIRLMVNSKPAMQRRCQAFCKREDSIEIPYKLGSLLEDWIPQLFCRDNAGKETKSSNKSSVCTPAVVPKSSGITWSIQGIRPPLDSNLFDLWQCLCHPDHFLYIVVVTQHE